MIMRWPRATASMPAGGPGGRQAARSDGGPVRPGGDPPSGPRVVLGLLADLPRKNCWSIAEHVGDRDPHGMQHFLARASWDTDGVRDDLRSYVVSQLGDPDAVLVFDETGDLKKGTCTVGVQRQYTGTAGRIENAQVAVYLTYASARGHAMIDRELYLPRCWSQDPQRCAEAGVPDGIEFLTKPALAAGMLRRTLR